MVNRTSPTYVLFFSLGRQTTAAPLRTHPLIEDPMPSSSAPNQVAQLDQVPVRSPRHQETEGGSRSFRTTLCSNNYILRAARFAMSKPWNYRGYDCICA